MRWSCSLAAGGGIPRYVQPPDYHTVRSGETLFSIAWRYDLDPADIARWNRLGDGSLIHPGDELRSSAAVRLIQVVRSVVEQPAGSQNRYPPYPTPAAAALGPGRRMARSASNFGGKPGTGTGILIDGQAGQPILAAASGRVVYAGSGLIGYGQLIIR